MMDSYAWFDLGVATVLIGPAIATFIRQAVGIGKSAMRWDGPVDTMGTWIARDAGRTMVILFEVVLLMGILVCSGLVVAYPSLLGSAHVDASVLGALLVEMALTTLHFIVLPVAIVWSVVYLVAHRRAERIAGAHRESWPPPTGESSPDGPTHISGGTL